LHELPNLIEFAGHFEHSFLEGKKKKIIIYKKKKKKEQKKLNKVIFFFKNKKIIQSLLMMDHSILNKFKNKYLHIYLNI
jgi:hypothetical protein